MSSLDSTDYSLTINLSSSKRDQLANNGFHLFAFRGVDVKGQNAQPVIWKRLDDLYETIPIPLTVRYGAFIGPEDQTYIPGSTSREINLGQEMTVDDNTHVEIIDGPSADAISIHNTGSKTHTAGISEFDSAKNTFSALCASILIQQALGEFTPTQKIAVIFATASKVVGSVIVRSMADGILVDLTQKHNRTILYDDNGVWKPDSSDGTQVIKANDVLKDYLINSPTFNQPALLPYELKISNRINNLENRVEIIEACLNKQ